MSCQCENVEIGSYDNTVAVDAPEFMRGQIIGCLEIRDTVCLDRCIAEEVQALWKQGIFTTGCCCGHGKQLGYIGVYGPENIQRMQSLGYEAEPGRIDTFFPKF